MTLEDEILFQRYSIVGYSDQLRESESNGNEDLLYKSGSDNDRNSA